MNIPIIFEDEYLLVADKPSGLIVVPSPKKETRTLTSILNDDLRSRGVSYRLHPCHRLDRDTSGLIIYAKGKSMQEKMMEEFKEKKVNKAYTAFVHGVLKKDSGEIAAQIENKYARTSFSVIERRKDFTVVKINPLTGRKNQIRLHFKSIGHPLVGEDKFIFRKDYVLRNKRVCLHAQKLEFTHPVTKKQVQLCVGLAKDMQDFLNKHA